ncbi:MAG: LysR family transcriptional regulator [Deltaproteobacteria bacterium]
MELKQLEYLVAVAEHGSMSKAARELRASQPTLSVAIKNLEEELNTTLLHRDSRGVSLTAAGRKLRDASQEVTEILERARAQIMDLEEEVVGDFTIGCNEALGAYFLPGFMQGFIERAPRVQLKLWNGTSAAARQAVIDRTIDFGVVVNPEPHPDLVMVKLFHDGIEVFVAVDEPLPRTRIEAMIRLKRGPLICARRIGPVRELLARFDADDALPDRILDCGDLQLVRQLTVAGLGVALLPRRVAQIYAGELVQLHRELPGFPDTICLLYRADLHRTQGAMVLKDALVEYGRELQSSDPNEDSILPPQM